MKLRDSIRAHPDLYRIAAAALSGLLLVVLFILTEPIDFKRHNTLMRYFSDLRNDEAQLGEAVMQLNFSLSNNYDTVNELMNHMLGIARLLREGEDAAELRKEADFLHELQVLDRQIAAKAEALETFKSRNALLKNSLIYLPHARDELLRKWPRGVLPHEHIDKLVEYILLKRISSALFDSSDFEAVLSNLEREANRLPPATRQQLETLLRHVRLVSRFEHELPTLVAQLAGRNGNNPLEAIYQQHHNRQQQRAALFRLFLLLATLSLLGYTGYILSRMRHQAHRLKLDASVFATASEGMVITDPQGSILDVNPAFTRVTGYTREEVIGRNPRILQSGRHDARFYQRLWQSLKETGHWEGEIWNRRKNGEIYPEWLSITAVIETHGNEKSVTHYVSTFSDISRRKQDEAELYRLAFFDALTKLPNRRLMMERLERLLAISRERAGYSAMLFIDIDNFKNLNDMKGHKVGDLFLQEIAHRLTAMARPGDTVARIGSDEFVMILERLGDIPDHAASQALAEGEKIIQALAAPYLLDDFEYRSSCSIGISLFTSGINVSELLKQADTAMLEAKAAGRNTVRFFDPAMQARLDNRAGLEADLHEALARQQFELHYQIQVDAERRPIGAEALLRWKHPQRGLLMPGSFIALAEETRLVNPIGQWVLQTACAQLKAWEADPCKQHLVLAVNVSARQFNDKDFVPSLHRLVNESGIVASRLKLEITESLLLDNIEQVIDSLKQLKVLGIRFSLDDFGTGYSSLQYLRRLPLDQIKIDQSFVREVVDNDNDRAIVRTIVAMAHSLEFDVIAEGVETEMQKEILLDLGCRHFQGYLFGKPLPREAFEALLDRCA